MGGLTDEVEISMSYGALGAEEKIMDFNTRQYEKLTGVDKQNGQTKLDGTNYVIRKMKLVMSSGILAANPGSQTGELLVGYPFSAVSTSQSTESMLLKLRVYLGSVLYRPENILILPHIAFEGVTSGCEARVDDVNHPNEYFIFTPKPVLKKELDKPVANMHRLCKELSQKCTTEAQMKEAFGLRENEDMPDGHKGFKWDDINKVVYFVEEEYNAVICRGSKAKKAENPAGYSVLTHNTGHLGCIDSPQCADRIWGTAGGQVYKADPNRV